MKKLLDILDRVILAVLVIMLSVMCVVGTMQVIWRYVLQTSLSWSEELMRFMYVWATMLGMCVAIRRGSFAKIDNLLEAIEKRTKIGGNVFRVVGLAVQVLVLVIFIRYGYDFTMRGMKQTSPAMGMKMGLIYASFPICGALGLLYTAEEAINLFKPKSE